MLQPWLTLLLSSVIAVSGDIGWGFVNPQSACPIHCMNGGVCAFSIAEPHLHKCICIIGMWEGERCEIPVTESPNYNNEETTEVQSTEITGRNSLEEMSNPTPSKQPDDFEKAETEKINKALKERIRQHIADEERLTQRAPIEEQQQAETEMNNVDANDWDKNKVDDHRQYDEELSEFDKQLHNNEPGDDGQDETVHDLPQEEVDTHAYPPQPIPREPQYEEYGTERTETEHTLPVDETKPVNNDGLRGFVGIEKSSQRPSNHQRTREELPREKHNTAETVEEDDEGWMMSSRKLRSAVAGQWNCLSTSGWLLISWLLLIAVV